MSGRICFGRDIDNLLNNAVKLPKIMVYNRQHFVRLHVICSNVMVTINMLMYFIACTTIISAGIYYITLALQSIKFVYSICLHWCMAEYLKACQKITCFIIFVLQLVEVKPRLNSLRYAVKYLN